MGLFELRFPGDLIYYHYSIVGIATELALAGTRESLYQEGAGSIPSKTMVKKNSNFPSELRSSGIPGDPSW